MSTPMTNKTTPDEDWLDLYTGAIYNTGFVDGQNYAEDEKQDWEFVTRAKAAINRQALATALRLIQSDDYEGKQVQGSIIPMGFTEVFCRNQLRQQLRQAFTDYYGGGEV